MGQAPDGSRMTIMDGNGMAPVTRSDHSHVCVHIETTPTPPGFHAICLVSFKTRLNLDVIRKKVVELTWEFICWSDDPADVLNHHLSEFLTVIFIKLLLVSGMVIGHDSMRRAEMLLKVNRLLITVGNMLVTTTYYNNAYYNNDK